MTASPPRFRPIRSLAHPLWLAALLVLLVNDHLFKGSSLPSWMTGKLSDFAGPIVAAALLGVALRVKSRRGWLLAHLATAIGFAAINVLPALAAWIETSSAMAPFPWSITVDPTDIIGLLALPFGYVVLGRASLQGGGARTKSIEESIVENGADEVWRRWVARIGVPVGAIACMATSQPDGDWDRPPPMEAGAIAVGNDTNSSFLIRIRPLKDTVDIDCNAVLADRSLSLPRQLFGAAETWLLEPGRALPLQNSDGDCSAYLVETEGMTATLLAWSHSEFYQSWVPTTTDVSDDRIARIIDAGPTWLSLQHSTASYLRSPEFSSGVCKIVPSADSVDWSPVPDGNWEVGAIESSPNGCSEISFIGGPDLVLCIPEELPFAIGESLRVSSSTIVQTRNAADSISLVGETVAIRVVRGSVLPFGAIAVEALSTCRLQHDECGNSVRAAQIEFGESGEVFGQSGDVMSMAPGVQLHLVRVQQMPARDLECSPAVDALDYLEYYTIENISEQP